jgi:hypothetical protein
MYKYLVNVQFWRETDRYYRLPQSADKDPTIFAKYGKEIYDKYVPVSGFFPGLLYDYSNLTWYVCRILVKHR